MVARSSRGLPADAVRIGARRNLRWGWPLPTGRGVLPGGFARAKARGSVGYPKECRKTAWQAPWPIHTWEIALFWFMLLALVAVVSVAALIALGGGGGLSEAPPDRLDHPLPLDRPVDRADVDAVRLPLAVRGYRMSEVDDVLDRVAAELTQRDARIADLEAQLAAHRATADRTTGDGTPGEEPDPGSPLTAQSGEHLAGDGQSGDAESFSRAAAGERRGLGRPPQDAPESAPRGPFEPPTQ